MWSLLRRTRGGSYPPTGGKIDVYLDESADAATLVVSDRPVARTVRLKDIGLVDLDKHDNVVAIELFGASKALERLGRPEQQGGANRRLDDDLRASASWFVEHARAHLEDGQAVEAGGAKSPESRV